MKLRKSKHEQHLDLPFGVSVQTAELHRKTVLEHARLQLNGGFLVRAAGNNEITPLYNRILSMDELKQHLQYYGEQDTPYMQAFGRLATGDTEARVEFCNPLHFVETDEPNRYKQIRGTDPVVGAIALSGLSIPPQLIEL